MAARARLDVQKKSAHALEQERPDVLKRRQAWFDGQLDLDPAKLVFIPSRRRFACLPGNG
ncbi:hypothetical protein BSQ44_12125 [Aquibium oceanicum]|uniref:Uncharacterized protein n=1 Tax=Aquibium oceanicum TaxID=1670800 RepID=A0A1L3SZ34_9HYPH|nr:hypothetical protein BSQ44_12125 [Aquibium oceanicum]